MQPLFLSLEEVLEIHQQQIENYGGGPGVRDISLLESAIAQPQATFSTEFLHDSMPAMAAAYLFHICRNHPFVDGNKRVLDDKRGGRSVFRDPLSSWCGQQRLRRQTSLATFETFTFARKE